MIATLPDRQTEASFEPILIAELTWREFKAVEQLIDRPGVRLSFLDGVLEIHKMPSKRHETIKERIGALLEIYLESLGLDFTPTGSMTLESESGQVKREGDKSYELGPDREQPDLVIEVVVTSGGIDKLEAYKRLNIPEVWFWIGDRLLLYSLQNEGYEAISQSQLLPHLDVNLFQSCIAMENHRRSLRQFRDEIK
ncbi:Uma2 family endonuclease [Spirulina sp. 06S082]|uniref:Uma2 family endonuclease n=1 Tax=Spirulina sp. 06S082 TaxID=3110248 RepID=UPI002B2033E7|nr:Uma2 family endonuclease [Spirulina sp. 06S082]MEA5469385.1 Uma2 family endonuclease [Spirulina sp. 06S082]